MIGTMSDHKRGMRPVSRGRRPRADAIANRARVLAAARDAFTEDGLDASLDDIAHRAGVGAGTVHRHFATKAELVDAVLGATVDELVAASTAYAAFEDVGMGLRDFLVHLITEGAAAHELAARLQSGSGNVEQAVSRPVARLEQVLGDMLSRAQQAGAVRDDLDERDLAAILAAAHAAYAHPAGGERAVRLVLRALD